jgi:chromate transporter
MSTRFYKPRPGIWQIFTIWLGVGLQSFGGGSATLFLIHRACIDRKWMDESEFARSWALVQVSPGINLIKLTALVGFQLRGWPGLLAAMAGILLPSAIITVVMTAGFSQAREIPAVQAALRGIAPATIGLSLAMAAQIAYPLLNKARTEGRGILAAHLLVLAGSALLLGLAALTPVAVLALSGAITAGALWFLSRLGRSLAESTR